MSQSIISSGRVHEGPKNPSAAQMTAIREELLLREIDLLRQELDGLRAAVSEGASSREAQRSSASNENPPHVGLWTLFAQKLRSLMHPRSEDKDNIGPNEQMPRRQILVVANYIPLFDQASGCLRLKTIIGLMGKDGWNITFGSMFGFDDLPGVLRNPDDRARYEGVLRACGVNLFLYGRDQIRDFIESEGASLGWAFLSFPDIAVHFLPIVRSHCPTTRIAYDMVDFHSLRMKRQAELAGDAGLLAAAVKQGLIEVACASAADITFAVSNEEKAAVLAAAPDAVVELLPNIFELPPMTLRGPESRKDLFFVGGFWHKPNGDAVRWFVERIFPLIQQEAPDTILCIAGANADDEVMALQERPGVEVLGFVPDLGPLFERHKVFVAPLRYGAGMKGKVGQSLAHGLPVVTTSIGAEGMALQDGKHVLIANDEAAFASQVLRLLKDNELWSRLSIAGRKQVEQTLSIDVIRGHLKAVLDG